MARPRKDRETDRHPVSVLRKTLGFTQKEMAEVAGCAEITLYAVQSGKLALSEKLADDMAQKTGVSAQWLLAGDPEAPIVAEDGKPYTRKYFEDCQREVMGPKESKRKLVAEYYAVPEMLGFALFKLYAVLRKAYRENRFAWTSYKVHTALDQLAKAMGVDEELAKHLDELNLKGEGDEKFINSMNFIMRMHNQAFSKKAAKFKGKKGK